jgi:proline dehydrogenase
VVVTQYLVQLQHTVAEAEHRDMMVQAHQQQTEQVVAEQVVVEVTKTSQQLVRATVAVIEDVQSIQTKDTTEHGQQ